MLNLMNISQMKLSTLQINQFGVSLPWTCCNMPFSFRQYVFSIETLTLNWSFSIQWQFCLYISVVFVIVYCKEWPIGPIRNLEIIHWHTWVWDEYVLLPGLINLISPGCAVAPHNYCTAAGPPGQMQMYSLYFAQLAELEQDNPGDAS